MQQMVRWSTVRGRYVEVGIGFSDAIASDYSLPLPSSNTAATLSTTSRSDSAITGLLAQVGLVASADKLVQLTQSAVPSAPPSTFARTRMQPLPRPFFY